MILAFDDDVWKVIINGAYGTLVLVLGSYFNYKLNLIQKRQIQNSEKIDLAASKAAVAVTKVESTAKDILQVKELAVASVGKMDEVKRATDGITDHLVEEARKAALAEGLLKGREQARTRSTDQPSGEVKEH